MTETSQLAARRKPDSFVVMRQRWSHLLFLHWPIDADAVQATLPPGLQVDTYQGSAYAAIVPFFMERIRPRFLPPMPGISWFLEMNVRTYVTYADGTPGVWFYSLDANQKLAVATARRFFHLNYIHSEMDAKRSANGTVDYSCARPGHDVWDYRYLAALDAPFREAEPGSLEFFLIERYVLFAWNPKRKRMIEGRVHHPPYRFTEADAPEWNPDPIAAAKLPAAVGSPCSALFAPRVDVSIFPPTYLRKGAS